LLIPNDIDASFIDGQILIIFPVILSNCFIGIIIANCVFLIASFERGTPFLARDIFFLVKTDRTLPLLALDIFLLLASE